MKKTTTRQPNSVVIGIPKDRDTLPILGADASREDWMKRTSHKTRYATPGILVRLRRYERGRFRFNQAISGKLLKRLDPELRLPVTHWFDHEQQSGPFKSVIRWCILVPTPGNHPNPEDDPVTVLVDMPVNEFFSLPVGEFSALSGKAA